MRTNHPSRCFRRLHLNVVSTVSAAFVLLLGTGCSVVSVPRPIGEKPHALVAADWEGTWIAERDVAKIKVVDAAAGQLQLVRWEGERQTTVDHFRRLYHRIRKHALREPA